METETKNLLTVGGFRVRILLVANYGTELSFTMTVLLGIDDDRWSFFVVNNFYYADKEPQYGKQSQANYYSNIVTLNSVGYLVL